MQAIQYVSQNIGDFAFSVKSKAKPSPFAPNDISAIMNVLTVDHRFEDKQYQSSLVVLDLYNDLVSTLARISKFAAESSKASTVRQKSDRFPG